MDLGDEVIERKSSKNYHDIDSPVDPKDLSIGDNELKGDAEIKTPQSSLLQRLDLNIVSIVLGALFFMIVITWVDTLRAACSGVINEDDDDRYHLFIRKVWATILITLISIFSAIVVYGWYKGIVNFVW